MSDCDIGEIALTRVSLSMPAGGTSPSAEQLTSIVVIISEARARREREAYAIPIAALGAEMAHAAIMLD
ncbi:MAG TPA: hypothetical protein VGO22_14555 [Pseudorhizobium sp.]|jgi:hypothetical protein|nr:hypothetical protein [Pseudorhizobium sp.]